MSMIAEDRLDPDEIRANLKTKRIGRSILVYARTTSTNDVAGGYGRNAANDGLVIFAEEQTAGRGRAGATWQSRPADSLLFSIVLIDCAIGGELLSLACAVALAEAIGQVGSHRAAIKWPNDIMLDGRKVAGILVESRRLSHNPTTIIGIGINCHQTEDCLPEDLRTTATSLDLAAGTRCRRVMVAKRVLTSLDSWLRVAERNRRQVIDAWSHLSTQLGQRVALSFNGKQFTGHCVGVDPENGLILQLDRGGRRMFDAAHTHIVR